MNFSATQNKNPHARAGFYSLRKYRKIYEENNHEVIFTVGLTFPTVIILTLQCDRFMCKTSVFAKISPFISIVHDDMTELACGHILAFYIRTVMAHKLGTDYPVGAASEHLVTVADHH